MDGAPAQSFCPECGAPVPLRGTAVTAVCEYCGSTIVRTDVDLRLVGKVSAILDNGSPIVLGSRGRFLSLLALALGFGCRQLGHVDLDAQPHPVAAPRQALCAWLTTSA